MSCFRFVKENALTFDQDWKNLLNYKKADSKAQENQKQTANVILKKCILIKDYDKFKHDICDL